MSLSTNYADEGDEPRTILQMPFPRKVVFFSFLALAILGVVFYLWWGLFFGVWIDNGVYAVVITLVLFGLAGMWLMAPNPPLPPLPPEHAT